MRYLDPGVGFIIFLIGLTIANVSSAGDALEVVKAEGRVVMSGSADPRDERAVASRSVLPPRSILTTGSDGRAVVRVGDDGYIVVEKNSTIEIDRAKSHKNFFRQVTGMIYYAMRAFHPSRKPIEIQTSTAIMGIRGTRFLVVDFLDRKEVGVRKGLVSITSLDKDFEIHRKAEQDEFEAFKQEGKDAIAKEKRDFEEYKAKSQREFIEYKREFTLGANRMASFDGKRVDDRQLSAEIKKDIEALEAFGKEWIDEVHD